MYDLFTKYINQESPGDFLTAFVFYFFIVNHTYLTGNTKLNEPSLAEFAYEFLYLWPIQKSIMKYKRILLKLSGEALMGEKQYGIDSNRLNQYAKEIKKVS